MLEDPRQQRSRRSFAVGAADDKRAFAADEIFLEQFRQRAVAQLALQHRLRLRVAARNGVADDDEVGLVREIALAVTVHHFDLPFGEERGHRRINVLVRAANLKAALLQRRRRGRHGRAANSDEVD